MLSLFTFSKFKVKPYFKAFLLSEGVILNVGPDVKKKKKKKRKRRDFKICFISEKKKDVITLCKYFFVFPYCISLGNGYWENGQDTKDCIF